MVDRERSRSRARTKRAAPGKNEPGDASSEASGRRRADVRLRKVACRGAAARHRVGSARDAGEPWVRTPGGRPARWLRSNERLRFDCSARASVGSSHPRRKEEIDGNEREQQPGIGFDGRRPAWGWCVDGRRGFAARRGRQPLDTGLRIACPGRRPATRRAIRRADGPDRADARAAWRNQPAATQREPAERHARCPRGDRARRSRCATGDRSEPGGADRPGDARLGDRERGEADGRPALGAPRSAPAGDGFQAASGLLEQPGPRPGQPGRAARVGGPPGLPRSRGAMRLGQQDARRAARRSGKPEPRGSRLAFRDTFTFRLTG